MEDKINTDKDKYCFPLPCHQFEPIVFYYCPEITTAVSSLCEVTNKKLVLKETEDNLRYTTVYYFVIYRKDSS